LLFGKRGGFIAAQLLRAIDETDKFDKKLKEIQGTSERAAEEIEKGLGGALRLVRSALQNLLISFADVGAEEFLNQFFRGMAEALRILARNAEAVTRAIKVMIAVFVVRRLIIFARALAIVTLRLSKMVLVALATPRALLKATFSIRAFSAALLAIPVLGWLTAIGLGIGAMTAFGDQITITEGKLANFSDVMGQVGDDLDGEFTNAINAVGPEFDDLGDAGGAAMSWIAQKIQFAISVFAGMGSAVKAIARGIVLRFLVIARGWEQFLLDFQQGVNSLRRGLGLSDTDDNIFNTDREIANLKVLDAKIKETAKEILLAGTVTESFISGVQGFNERVADRALNRLRAELDAARTAALQRDRAAAAPEKEDVDPGRDVSGLLEAEKLAAAAAKAAAELKRLTDALRSLEAAHFPLIAVQKAEADILKTISDAAEKDIFLKVNQTELLKRAARAQLGLGMTVDQAQEQQKVYDDALEATNITLAEHLRLTRDLNIEMLENTPGALAGVQLGLLQVGKTADDVGSQISDAIVGAFNEATEAFLEFVKTGKFSFKGLIDFIIIELTRLAFQKSVVSSLTNLFSGIIGGVAAGTGVGGVDVSPGTNPNITGDPGISAAHGASFTVGTSNSTPFSGPGPDDRLVQFRAFRGEDVDVTPPGGKRNVGDTTRVLNMSQNFNIINPIDPDGFKRAQPAMAVRGLQATERFKQRIGG
jgi:lambda family phage tail tape measure protein